MGKIIIVAIFVLFVFLLISASIKRNIEGESKLSVFEHPDTFEKPEIEMTSLIDNKEKEILNKEIIYF